MENVRELFQIFTRRFGFLNKNCCTVDQVEVSVIHSHILYEINRKESPSMQEVAETLGTDITTFSRQVQSMIKMDLVLKTPHPKDRRIQLLSLTTKGKEVAEAIDKQMKQYFEELFSVMSVEEKEMVLKSMSILNKAMAKSNRCCSAKID